MPRGLAIKVPGSSSMYPRAREFVVLSSPFWKLRAGQTRSSPLRVSLWTGLFSSVQRSSRWIIVHEFTAGWGDSGAKPSEVICACYFADLTRAYRAAFRESSSLARVRLETARHIWPLDWLPALGQIGFIPSYLPPGMTSKRASERANERARSTSILHAATALSHTTAERIDLFFCLPGRMCTRSYRRHAYSTARPQGGGGF